MVNIPEPWARPTITTSSNGPDAAEDDMNAEDRKAMELEIRRLRGILDDEDDVIRHRENAKLVGKCFRFRNSYGSAHEGWWLYNKVTALDGDGNLKVFSFQRTSMHHIEIKADEFAYGTSTLGDPIDPSEFRSAWDDQLTEIHALSELVS